LGAKIKLHIGNTWKREPITLDFAGVDVVSPSFLDEAVGHIIQKLDDMEVRSNLRIIDPPMDFDRVWKNVLGARRARASSPN